jgi:L-lactate dehydrogenase complex protein LldG
VSARDDILRRVRSAVGDVDRSTLPPIDHVYGRSVSTGSLDRVDRFCERVDDYRATVVRCAREDVGQSVRDALTDLSGPIVVDDVLVPRLGADGRWTTDGGADTLDGVDAVVTTAAVGVANTGTIVLDHGEGQGRRAATLVPDRHVCIVDVDQIVGDVPEAVARLLENGSAQRPLTWISGPSATSDIELDRVEGVHGPRTLVVVVAG